MSCRRSVVAVAAAIAAAGVSSAGMAGAERPAAAGPAPLELTLERGWIGSLVSAAPGAQVAIGEQVSGQFAPLEEASVPASGVLAVPRLAPWLCARRTRTFTLRILTSPYAPTVSATVTTPSCAARLIVRAPVNVTAGARASVAVADSWGTGGVRFTLCVIPPAADAACRGVSLRAGQSASRLPVRFLSVGHWLVTVRTPFGERLSRSVKAAHPRGRVVLLATGDSEIQEVNSDLAAALTPAHVQVISDARVGSGISKVALFDWVRHAAGQAAELHPDITVVFIGANDGFALQNAAGVWTPCCSAAWVGLFAARAERMMASYLQGSRGRVFWFTLPIARDPAYAGVFAAVNRAYMIAAAKFPGVVQLIRADRIFTPGGRFTQTISYDGRQVSVRAPDGIHLSPSGAQIAAAAVVSALRASRILG